MRIPSKERDRLKLALDTIEKCRISQGRRASSYRQYGQWLETGRAAGGLALANMLYAHVDRLASHLFLASELRFAIDFENLYQKEWLEKGAVAARVVSREWERKNIDILFGQGVKESLTYGASVLKQIGGRTHDNGFYFRGARLVPPWAFGVYNESLNDLDDQEAFCETVWLTRSDVWRRIANLPEAEKLFDRIIGHANRDTNTGIPNNFMHQVLSTAILDVSLQNATQPTPGGIVQIGNDPNSPTLGPEIAPELFPMHELWVKNDETNDWTTFQVVEPDILIAPRLKLMNLFAPEVQPYSLIQANHVTNYFWGRSELADLMELQAWLTSHLDDTKRLVGQQIDKILAFIGFDGINDENYGTFRESGYFSLPQGAEVKDLTPALPTNLLEITREIISMMERVSGFPPIMSGQGEPGVRAGVHADTLMKTGSPRLRDRSLLVERQCASAADKTLALLEAKEAKAYWTQPDKPETEFLLSQLPDDRRISVDAHSVSPIFHDDNLQLLSFGLKAGIVTPTGFIEQAPFAHKDILIHEYREAEKAKQEFMVQHPEFFAHQRGGRKKM